MESGQLADIVAAGAESIKTLTSARSPPVGQPSYMMNPQQTVSPVPQQVPQQAPQQVPQQVPQQLPEITFTDKCRTVMGQIHESLPSEWTENSAFIEILKRSTERAVTRAEDLYPTSVELQIERALVELVLIVNLRLIGTSLQHIKRGTVTAEKAAELLKDHPLFEAFKGETYESLMDMISSYADCDPPGQKNLGWDIEFLTEPENRQHIEAVLLATR